MTCSLTVHLFVCKEIGEKKIPACYIYWLSGSAGVFFQKKQHHLSVSTSHQSKARCWADTLIQDIQGLPCFVTLWFWFSSLTDPLFVIALPKTHDRWCSNVGVGERGGVLVYFLIFFFFNPNETFRSSESSYKSLKPAWTIPNVYSSLNNGTYYAKLCHYWEENFDHPILNYSSERHSDRYHYWPRNSSYILCQISMYPRPLNTLFFHSPLCEAVLMHKDP